MNKPPMTSLLDKVDSKYTLIIVAAKRARSLIDDNPEAVTKIKNNPVSVALKDIAEGKVSWTRIKDGMK